MILSIARQSVILKCLREKSVLVGNYEYYYIAGLMKQLFGLEVSEEMRPQEICDRIQEKFESITPANPQEAYLLKMVQFYEPKDHYDGQMKELFLWGEEEKDLWQVNTSVTR